MFPFSFVSFVSFAGRPRLRPAAGLRSLIPPWLSRPVCALRPSPTRPRRVPASIIRSRILSTFVYFPPLAGSGWSGGGAQGDDGGVGRLGGALDPGSAAWGGWRDRHAPISHQNAPPGPSTLVPAVSPRDAATSPVAPRLDGSGGMTWTPWGPSCCPRPRHARSRPRHALTTSDRSDQVPIRPPSGPPAQGSRGLIRA